jgi:predicted acylesterase/phospholipase RssA
MTERVSSNHNDKHNKQRALVLQGGGALGAYEVGVLKGLCKKLIEKDKERGIDKRSLFDIVAGTSIGAMNAAVLVSNVVKKDKTWSEAVGELERFWKEGIALEEGVNSSEDIVPVGIFRIFPWWKPWTEQPPKWALCTKENSKDEKAVNTKVLATEEAARRYYSTKVFVYGGKKVFSIKDIRVDTKFLDHDPLANWIVLDDIPLRSQIEAYGDFPIATRFDKGEPRLLITAVDIVEGVTVTFDSYKKADGKRKTVYYPGGKYGRKKDENSNPIVIEYEDGITLDQVMAGGALPEFYDPKEINGRKFWDGGILSNTPLHELLSAHKDYWVNVGNKEVPDLEIYIVNVHSSTIEDSNIPKNYDEVRDRNFDILYGDRTYHDQCSASLVTDYIDFITNLHDLANDHIKDDNEKNAFQKKFEKLQKEKAKATSDTLGENITHEDLIRGRFETKIIRIERKHDVTTSTSLKGADITIQTIDALIDQGEKDTKDIIVF